MRVGTETLGDVFGKADVAFPVSEFQNINSAPEPRTDEGSDRGVGVDLPALEIE